MEANKIANQYTMEMLMNFMEKFAQKPGEQMDLLTLYAEENEKKQNDIIKGISNIDSKIDTIIEKLSKLETDFSELKNESRNMEEKIMLMSSKLSKIENDVAEEELEDYYALAQSLYVNWEGLDDLTRKFIPLAEYLYSKLQKFDKPDYSPVIIELCRAIENEFLLKIFRKYTLDLIRRHSTKSSLNNFLSSDRINDKTRQFAAAINRAYNNNNPEYTLGQMNMILSIATDRNTVSLSPLLQDFVSYLNNNTEAKNLLDTKYIDKINDIVNKYRNPSAHPEYMSRQKAEKGKEIMPDRLDYLLECVFK